MHKSLLETQNFQNSVNSTHILKQLQQNESLRTQVYKLKALLRSQSSKYQNTLTSQQMITEKLITSLRMAIKNQISLKRQQTIQQSHQFLCSTIQKCLYDLQNLCELYGSAKSQCKRQMKQNAAQSHSGRSDKSFKINNDSQSFQQIVKQRNNVNIKYQNCLKQNQELKRKLLQSFEELKKSRLNINKLQNTINQQRDSIRQKQNQVQKLSDQNDAVITRIKENQETSRKHVDYLRKKSEQIQQQNEKLILLHRDAVFRQKQLIKIVEEGQLQIQKLFEEGNRLKLELQTFQLKMNEIIQKQQKIKSLQNLIRSRGQENKSLKQIINRDSIKNSAQPYDSKQTIKAKKRFNLQLFQQKLCSSSTSLVC